MHPPGTPANLVQINYAAQPAEQSHTVYWTEDILTEALYHLRRDNPTWDGGVITTIRKQIVESLEGGRVEDFVINGMFPGGDVHDQHVHAAALACQADIILTADEGFSDLEILDELPYEVYRPDDFFMLTDDSAPDVVRQVVGKQVSYFFRRDGEADLCAKLRKAQCPQFAERVRVHLRAMS